MMMMMTMMIMITGVKFLPPLEPLHLMASWSPLPVRGQQDAKVRMMMTMMMMMMMMGEGGGGRRTRDERDDNGCS
jgi:hypothetical protein